MQPKPSRRHVARIIRRVPGYRYARRSVLPRVRASPSAQSLVKRVFDIDAEQAAPLDVEAGNLLGGVGVERLPVVAVIMISVPSDRIGDVVDDVARLQVLTAGFRPVFVMDTPMFGATRRYGYPVEFLTARSSWDDSPDSWGEYAGSRIRSVIATYRTSATVSVHPSGLDENGRLLLGSLGGMTRIRRS